MKLSMDIKTRNNEAERTLLGLCLTNKRKLLDFIKKINSGDFYDSRHREAYEIILSMVKNNVDISKETFLAELAKRGYENQSKWLLSVQYYLIEVQNKEKKDYKIARIWNKSLNRILILIFIRPKILTYGLSAEENDIICKDCKIPYDELYDISADDDALTDIYAVDATLYIIDPKALKDDELEDLLAFWYEVKPDENTFIFTEKVGLNKKYKEIVTEYDGFDNIRTQIKYTFLKAEKKKNKNKEFSSKLSDCIKILSMLCSRKSVTITQLSEELGLSKRTITRRIETLRIAGECIIYDPKTREWRLQDDQSLLFNFNSEK